MIKRFIIFMLLYFIICTLVLWIKTIYVAEIQYCEFNSAEKIKRRMKYHGILHTYKKDNVWYFKNKEGKECKL